MRTRWRSSITMAEAARTQRRKPTKGETYVWAMLRSFRNSGWAFRRQVPMDQFVIDFYCPKVKLAIEVDGSVHNSVVVQENDVARQLFLECHYGITFLRFTNYDAINFPLRVREIILAKLHQMSP
jgi:very-short-patch-repair endonuclease